MRRTQRHNKDGSTVSYYQLAENSWDPDKQRSRTTVIHNFGRADQLDFDKLRRLAQSILRVYEAQEPAALVDPDIQVLWSKSLGGIHILESLWNELGIRGALEQALRREGFESPLERALFAMVANRALDPSSKLGCCQRWLRDQVYFPEGESIELQHLYRAMDALERFKDQVEEEIFWRSVSLFNAEVDLIFYDTTSIHFEVEYEDALRRRGHSKNGRGDAPQVVVGLAVTRDGLPVRSWVFAGNTADVTTVKQVKADLKGWKLGRFVFVGDRGMVSEENLKELSRGGTSYIVGVPMRRFKEVSHQVLARAGRYQHVRDNLEVKEAWVPESGERRRRYVICRNPYEAERHRELRERHLEVLRAELCCEPTSKQACDLASSRRYGKYLKLSKAGRLSLDSAKIKAEERLDGKYVLTTNDDTLSAEDVALGYKQLQGAERAFRHLKSDLDIRPVFHHRAARIKAHVSICVLALLLTRAAEIRTGQTWAVIRHHAQRLHAIRFRSIVGEATQTSQAPGQLLNILKKLGIIPPKRLLNVQN